MEDTQTAPPVSVRDETNDPGAPKLPRYRSHKIVEALEILSIDPLEGGGARISPVDLNFAPFTVSAEYVAKHNPQPGGYWVRYADGYESWSPAEAFESGYTLISVDDDEQPTRSAEDAPLAAGCSPITVTMAAAVAHEVNRVYCLAIGESQPSWNDAPDWQRSSAINGVLYLMANPDAGPEASHENWLREKEATGWKHGPVKDVEAKTHPCMVPFTELPLEQQVKDHLFVGVVRSLAQLAVIQAAAGLVREIKAEQQTTTDVVQSAIDRLRSQQKLSQNEKRALRRLDDAVNWLRLGKQR